MSDESIPSLIKELSKSLLDPTLLKRYGTNLNPSMSLDYEKYLMKRYNELKQEFIRINKNIEDGITIDELTEFLNSYSKESGRQFNKDYAEKMYNLLDLDQNKEITMYISIIISQEFIFSYILLEERLRLKQIRLQKFYDELLSTKEKYNTAMIQNKNERINKYGISENALLYITVLEGKGLKSQNKDPDPYVVITTLGNKQMSTYRPDSLDPIWNEDFTLYLLFKISSISSKEEAVKIEVFDNDFSQGCIEMIMKDLCDQQKYEGWFSLVDVKGEPTHSQIRLRIQFIWSRYVYFHGKCEKVIENLNKLNEDIVEINKYLEMFNKPYGLILYAEILEILNKKVFDDQDDIVYSMPKFSKNISILISHSHIQNEKNEKFFNKLKEEFSIFTKILIIFYFIFTLLSLIKRSDFVNLALSVVFLGLSFFDTRGKLLKNIKMIILIFFLTLLYDFGWLILIGISYYYPIRSKDLQSEQLLEIIWFYISACSIISKLSLIFSLINQYFRAQEVDRIMRDSKLPSDEDVINQER